MDTYIAADIGGTQLRVAVYPKNSTEPIIQKRIATRGDGTPIERLIDLIADVWPKGGHVLSIGADFPGPIDPRSGVLISAPNIPEWINLPLKQILFDRFQVPVAIGNDANMAALGEWKFGAGVGHHHLVYLTISTGIGGGVICDDHLLLGQRGLAAELGHITVLPNGPLCGCGQRGHLEAVGSGTGIAAYFAEQQALGRETTLPTGSTARDISQAAEKGDLLSREAMARAGTFVGLGIANFLQIFNPSIIILGGGVSHSGPAFYEPLHATVRAQAMRPEFLDNLVITNAKLGDDCGLLGSLALAQTLIEG